MKVEIPKKRCTLPEPSGSKKSGVPYQSQVGAKKAVYPTRTKWERKKRSIHIWIDHFILLSVN